MYAIIEAGAKQYKVSEKQKIRVEKIKTTDKKIIFDKVLMFFDGTKTKIGKPYIEKASVEGKIIAEGKSPKLRILKFKPKKRYQKVMGHRQSFTEIEIQKIKGV